MGVVDGSTPYGDIIKAGPEANFPTPPTVVADADRRSLATAASSSLNWMREFFTTTSNPVGHGFTQTNLDNDFTSYSFQPKSDIPIKVIALDDTCKGAGPAELCRRLSRPDPDRLAQRRTPEGPGRKQAHDYRGAYPDQPADAPHR